MRTDSRTRPASPFLPSLCAAPLLTAAQLTNALFTAGRLIKVRLATGVLSAGLLGAALAGCAPAAPEQSPGPAPPRASAARQEAPPVGAAPADAHQAGLIVTERYGGLVAHIDPDQDDDQPIWSVHVRGSDRGDIEGHVDRRTGTLLEVEKD